jgi:hypothetical protein
LWSWGRERPQHARGTITDLTLGFTQRSGDTRALVGDRPLV